MGVITAGQPGPDYEVQGTAVLLLRQRDENSKWWQITADPFPLGMNSKIICEATQAWLERHRLTDRQFPTLKQARSVLTAISYIEPPPPVDDTVPGEQQLRIVEPGVHRTRDAKFEARRESSDRNYRWTVYKIVDGKRKRLVDARDLHSAQMLIVHAWGAADTPGMHTAYDE